MIKVVPITYDINASEVVHNRESILIVQPPTECFWSGTYNGRAHSDWHDATPAGCNTGMMIHRHG